MIYIYYICHIIYDIQIYIYVLYQPSRPWFSTVFKTQFSVEEFCILLVPYWTANCLWPSRMDYPMMWSPHGMVVGLLVIAAGLKPQVLVMEIPADSKLQVFFWIPQVVCSRVACSLNWVIVAMDFLVFAGWDNHWCIIGIFSTWKRKDFAQFQHHRSQLIISQCLIQATSGQSTLCVFFLGCF